MNESRIAQIQHRQSFERGRHRDYHFIGETVVHNGETGVIDAAFFDLQAAVDSGVIDGTWYVAQRPKPKTHPDQHWYSVILPHGAVLIGEEDL